MSEKVLGFYKKDGWKMELSKGWFIDDNKLVPVRLRSESVDLKKLKEQIKKAFAEELFWINKADVALDNPRVHLKKVKDDLLSWAEKQAGEKKE